MDRREMLMGSVAALALAATGNTMADDMGGMAGMGKMEGMEGMHHDVSKRNMTLINAASDCVLKANLCLQHCIVAMGKGDAGLADCAKSSSQVIAMCSALQQMASAESKHLPQLAKVAMEVCKDCQEECRKTEKHPECKACEEACETCYNECKRIAA